MDRFAVFVDAGYLYAGAGKLCCRTPKRKSLQVDAMEVNQLLVCLAKKACGLPPLRTYWYDGAKKSIPTREQQRIAALPNVKLRLGRLNIRNQQKGVDALIYRDLITLARERAISEAYVLSGDEDLREGVRAAQDMGVRVTLIGIATPDRSKNQSRELVYEVDETVTLTKEELDPFIKPFIPIQPAALINPSGERDHTLMGLMTPDEIAAGHQRAASAQERASAAATRYAQQWVDQATDDARESLIASQPEIPVPLDASLLGYVEGEIGESLRGRQELRRTVRRAFWEQIASRG